MHHFSQKSVVPTGKASEVIPIPLLKMVHANVRKRPVFPSTEALAS
jgi:hypothetical protein